MKVDHISHTGETMGLGSPALQLPLEGVASTIQANDAIELSSENIDAMNKRQRYASLFRAELEIAAEKQNAKKLEKQARRN